MRFTLPAASFLALALFAVPSLAQGQPEMLVAQASAVPAEVQALLDDKRPLSELTVKELTQRIRLGRGFMRSGKLPRDVQRQLRTVLKAAATERATRSEAGGQAPAKPAAEDTANTGAGAVDETAEPDMTAEAPAAGKAKTKTAAAETPNDALSYLNDKRAAKDLTPEELRARVQLGRKLFGMKDLSRDVRQQIRSRMRADRAELRGQRPGGNQAGSDNPPEMTPDSPGNQTVDTGQPAPDEGDLGKLDRNDGNADEEARAKAILADNRQPGDLSDGELRTRLRDIRALMKGNKLSGQTEKRLRQKLAGERKILRGRVANTANNGGPADGGKGTGQPDKKIDPGYLNNIEIVLKDRRQSDELTERELRRRIRVFLNAIADEQYAAAERARWRELIQLDRRFLKQRLVTSRGERQRNLRNRGNPIDINLAVDLGGDEAVALDAAEADDEEIEDILVAAPRRKFDRRYSVEEIENSAELRDALPRVEIDTIRFGFNESFVREEEVENLDRVGEIIERILAEHPREVFLIEGHTDAVGQDRYNLDLSRERATAVKQALAEYYVIPAENLRTAGYGERFLKIPTAEAEEENRRVAISRATALIGELEN